jgi:hypothetical protein
VVTWWDLGAAGMETGDGVLVVQRHAIERWDPRLEDEYTGADDDDTEDEEQQAQESGE